LDQIGPGLTAREEKELRALQRRKERERQGLFLAEGVRVVEDLLASSLRVRWVLASSSLEDSERGTELTAEVERRGIPLRVVPERDFARHAGTESPQGVLAVAEIPRWSPADIRGMAGFPDVVLVLDAVQDPGNFGTLVRSAEALGAAGVLALPGTVDPWNPKAIRAAVGSSFRMPILSLPWSEAGEWLRGRGFEVIAAAVGGEPVRRPERPTALVVGNEGAGISAEVAAGVDRVVGIPLRGRAESLNVAAAAAILLYELTR
jgi:TrmH family RNA methyltransferase